MLKKIILFSALIFITHTLNAQVIGSRDNSDSSPSSVEPSQLTGGGYTGDVNVFNGTYSASYPLGSVSTPGGLSFGVNLNYSPSYSAGETPSVSSGIPYGEGWNVGLPTITASNAAYFSFLATYECNKKSHHTKDLENYLDTTLISVNGMDVPAANLNGDVFWFSPTVSIPGVGSGRAVFKYIDQDDAKCAVFVLNKFERYIELRFYGDRWTVLDDGGNFYQFSTTLVTYRAPNNARILNYNGLNNNINNDVADIIVNNDYGTHTKGVLNVLEPKEAYTSWYCSSISNRNIPNQSILFEYEKFGAFNYYKEFQQPIVAAQIGDKLRDDLTLGSYDFLDYTAYSDIILSKVSSFVQNSPFEILDLGYATSDMIGARMLDPTDEDVDRLDSLYAYTTVFSDGLATDEFEDWNRYFHGKSDSSYALTGENPTIDNRNPYYTHGGNGTAFEGYIRSEVGSENDIPFTHAFLESPRILDDPTTLIPGDIYEIKTRISDVNGSNAAMGTGTIDINVVTGDLGLNLPSAYSTDTLFPCDPDSIIYTPISLGSTYSSLNGEYGGNNQVYRSVDYNKTRSTPVFTTHNQAVKWHLPSEATNVSTSNFFVMPNIPDSYNGVNIQVGPGNSDTEYGIPLFTAIGTSEYVPKHPSAYNSYSHMVQNAFALASYEDIPNSFGMGMPWSMVAPLYVDQMGGIDEDNVQHTDAYDLWYNIASPIAPHLWDNEPTKFNENVRLEEIEVVRYSKTPYMLSSIKLFRINGEISPLDDTSGVILIAQNDLEYSYESKGYIENYPYRHLNVDTTEFPCYNHADTLFHSTAYLQYVYTLDNIKTIPVAGWDNNPGVAASYADTSLLQTDFEYDWYGYEDGEVLVFDVDGHPGRRTKVMTKYIDQLGGETQIDYYPRSSENTLKEGRYTGIQKCASYGSSIFGQGYAYDVHPAVQYLTKLDEHNNLEGIIPGQPLKRWEYIYDTTQIIYQSFDYFLTANFRGGYKKSYSKGFAKSTVLSPELETGEQNYTEYFHHGNIYQPTSLDGAIIPDTSTIEEYLYFGKPSRIVQYNYLDQIEEETIVEYAHTKAFENGYVRNRMSRDNLISPTDFESTTNWVHGREYEYADYYKGETNTYSGPVGYALWVFDGKAETDLTYTIGDTIVGEMTAIVAYTDLQGVITSVAIPGYEAVIPNSVIRPATIMGTIEGGLAKPIAISNSYIGDNWGGPYEKAKFLETYFYEDLHAANPDFYFHSYFLKTKKQTSRSYDDFCSIEEEGGGLIIIAVGETVAPNPFGPSIVNITTAQNDNMHIQAIDGSTDGLSIEYYLTSESPLSETVLDTLVAKIGTYDSGVIKNVLMAQSALTDDILNAVFSGLNLFQQSQALSIFLDQPYLSDAFLMGITAGSSQQQDQLIKKVYSHNTYLSDTVMIKMAEESNFSQNVLKDVLLRQGQMSEEVLIAIASESNSNASFAIEALLLNQPILTDAIFYEVAENSTLGNNKVLSIFSGSQSYPSDNALISLMNRTPVINEQSLVTLMQSTDHYFGDSLQTKIYAELAVENADLVIEYLAYFNPYGILCKEDVVEGRDYIESITEYDYYEANYDGSTLAEGYKKLMSLEDVEGKVVLDDDSDLGYDITLTDIKLKHQPSWQLFKTKSYSPDYPEAYQEQEYFYYYDLLNRKSRHFMYYDLSEDVYSFVVDTVSYHDTAIFSTNWPLDHQHGLGPEHPNSGHIPLHDGEKNAQRNNLRSIAFQKTTFTKNNQFEPAIMRSEYYNYDSRWNRPEIDIDSTIDYSGPNCEDLEYSEDYSLDCDDCFSIKWTGSEEEIMEQVPWGYCAYYITGAIKCCPAFVKPEDCGYSVTSQIGCNPDSEDPSLDTVMVKVIQVEDALDRGMYFRSFVVQIDSIPSTETEWGGRTDEKNSYIMDFYLGVSEDRDEHNRRNAYASYPFDTLTVRTVDERNRYTQVQLEHNTSDIFTKYDYESTLKIWHRNINNGPDCPGYGNYSSIVNRNIGMPVQITVGFGRDDSMSTQYAYYSNYSIDSIVNANGHRLHYSYDDYDRLENSYDNSRLLSNNNYQYWQRDTSLSFQNRTAQNYVETNIYSGPSSPDEHVRAYMDPLGRNYSAITTVDNDSTQVHSGTVWYDNWGRVSKAFKPYKLSDQASLLPTSDTTLAYAHNLYEDTQKGRVLRSAKYGITDIMDTHTTKQSYKLIDQVVLSCELNLKATEAALLIHSEFEGDLKFIRVETEDEDGKQMVSYTNAVGQQIATMQYGESMSEELITLFAYDNYGNLCTVINPEEQWTYYEFNILGQLIKEITLDAGTTKYMYNKQGQLSISQDENGRFGDVPPLETDTIPFFRVYEYDDYGRLLVQKRTYWKQPATYPVINNTNIDPLFYTDTISNVDVGGPIIINDGITEEEYFEYYFSNKSSYDWMAEINYVVHPGGPVPRESVTGSITDFINLTGGIAEKQFSYGADTSYNQLGKVKQTFSYNKEGGIIEKTSYTYNDEEQVLTELIEFSATGDYGDPSKVVKTKITYPQYNYRGSIEFMEVDIANDGVLDFQYKYNYDNWNRLTEIWVSYADGEDGNRVVSYDYNDALGLLTETKHYVNKSNTGDCGEQDAQTIEHSYDVRDRLTEISSELFDYNLFYDDNTPSHADFTESLTASQNWNGNINGTVADYKLDGATNAGSMGGFDQATVYGFKYDLVNRLYLADAHAGDDFDIANSNSYGIGDVEYNYDRIGNITNLKRGLELDGTDLLSEEWNYKYFDGTNKLQKVQGVGVTGDRNYTYDLNGNLLSDDERSLSDIKYARANYPYHITKGSLEIDYLYSIGDQRIYKETQAISDTSKEYYLKNIGILDITNNNWTWYVTGADRVAKITPLEYQQPKNIAGSTPSTLNDQLFTSFYLYDHLGNTRVVYTPEIQCPTFVMYEIDFAADYYPYGKTLRQFVSVDEKFLTTQHERDAETGLDYRGARLYDSDVARFLSLDPLAADYPSLSDYSYVAGNPIVFTDPTGMAVENDYIVGLNGTVTLVKETDDNYDRLFESDGSGGIKQGGDFIKVGDQSILSQLSAEGANIRGYLGPVNHAITESKDDVFKVFKFVADRTTVEWSLDGYRSNTGRKYVIGTQHIGNEAIASYGVTDFSEFDMIFQIHSHPGGYKPSTGEIDSYGTPGGSGGDMGIIGDRYRRYKSAGMISTNKWFEKDGKYTHFPRHYVYHKKSQTLYNFTPWQSNIYIREINNYRDFYFGVF